MIKFFRHIRKQLLGEGKTGKYFKYALGEILLVMIGILLALQVNNWNEVSKKQKQEREVLLDLHTALLVDLNFFNNVYQPLFNQKAEGVEFLKKAVFENQDYSKDTLKKYLGKSMRDIVFRYDKGPYDALKSSGYELISNKELRKNIIHAYEVKLPNLMHSINAFTEDKLVFEHQYENELMKEVVEKTEDGKLEIYSRIKVDNFIEHPSLISLLAIEQDKYENYINQMKLVNTMVKNLINQIEIENHK